MDAEEIKIKRQQIIEQYGEWTAHNIQLKDDIYTINVAVLRDEGKLRRFVQCVADLAKKPLEQLRVLDLACLEGLYGIELARRGAQVVGLEVRTANLEKAKFAGEVLGLTNYAAYLDDVRNLSREKYGEFDVVLCLGILYHLDSPDVFQFLERIAEVCTEFVIFDTHISLKPEVSVSYQGKDYWGCLYQEHDEGSTAEQRADRLWSSIDNTNSFWFTRPSLYNVLSHIGFTSLYECHFPPEPVPSLDRLTLVAIKGQPQTLCLAPLLNGQTIPDFPEAFATDTTVRRITFGDPEIPNSEASDATTEPVKADNHTAVEGSEVTQGTTSTPPPSPSQLRSILAKVLPAPVKRWIKQLLR